MAARAVSVGADHRDGIARHGNEEDTAPSCGVNAAAERDDAHDAHSPSCVRNAVSHLWSFGRLDAGAAARVLAIAATTLSLAFGPMSRWSSSTSPNRTPLDAEMSPNARSGKSGAELGDPIYDENGQADAALRGQIPRGSFGPFPHHPPDHLPHQVLTESDR